MPGAVGRLPDANEPTEDSIPVILARTLGTALPAEVSAISASVQSS